jgi:hypothetical protein
MKQVGVQKTSKYFDIVMDAYFNKYSRLLEDAMKQ